MSLVDEKYIESTDGIKKTIDKNSMGMALDILQRGLYAHPIQSTVRELASNGYDAIIERDVAKSIILGESSIEDHFDVTKINGIYHASGWDPTYFDLNWLSTDPNCYLYYEEGPQKDMLRVVDHGVGLGKTRLVNYFMLNWSSKRANKDTLGNKGLGSKVALSLGVTSFRVITKYNGKKFKFDVFLDKVESVIPKFNSKGVANEPFILVPEKRVTLDDGIVEITEAYIAYCEATEDKNGVEIQVEVKKHNKTLFFEAIEAQLMYMPSIKFMHRAQGSTTHEHIEIAAKILFQSQDAIISESTVFDRPHILLGVGKALVCYGQILFNELELEPKRGSVGLILDINDIEVTPSRESPIWSAKTREAVIKKYKLVSEMASTYLNNELASETDYLLWVTKAAQILGSMRQGGSNTSVLGRLASIIDMNDIGAVTFPGNSKIIFDTKPKEMLGESLTVRNVAYNRYTSKVDRKVLSDLCTLIKPLYFTKLGSNPFRDRYLFEEFGDFVLVNVKENADLDDKGTLVVNSTLLKDYDSIVVPEDRLELYLAEASGITEDEEDSTDTLKAPPIDYSALRKANKQIVVHVLSGTGGTYDYKFSPYDYYITDIFNKFANNIVLYTTGGDRQTMSNILALFPQGMLECAGHYLFDRMQKCCIHTTIPTQQRITGILLAQENVKYVSNSSKYLSITDFMLKSYSKKTGVVVFSDLIKFTATSSVIAKIYREKFSGITNRVTYEQVELIDPKLQQLALFCDDYYNAYDKKPLKDIMSHKGFLQNVVLYQLYKTGLVSASEETVEELLGLINDEVPDCLCELVDEITDIDILDVKLIKECIDLFDYYAPRKEMLQLFSQQSSYATEQNKIIAEQLKEYFKFVNNKTI